ncbi:MAG: DUF952 domain-containing protein [Jatrophihabitans sp.]|uniref:DUF952 domain-containing protein n=1 Tax=Jatrophihabitans sp. TaxID=1932789 RepID=UPI003F7DB03B
MRLFHLVDPREWAAAVTAGHYAPPSLAAEGFVHLSFAEQVAGSANTHYPAAARLVAVEFDDASVAADLRAEDSYGSGTAFPHVYAPLDPSLAVAVHPLARDAGGAWVFSAPDRTGRASRDR